MNATDLNNLVADRIRRMPPSPPARRRTYALDAAVCDAWFDASQSEHNLVRTDEPMRAEIERARRRARNAELTALIRRTVNQVLNERGQA